MVLIDGQFGTVEAAKKTTAPKITTTKTTSTKTTAPAPEIDELERQIINQEARDAALIEELLAPPPDPIIAPTVDPAPFEPEFVARQTETFKLRQIASQMGFTVAQLRDANPKLLKGLTGSTLISQDLIDRLIKPTLKVNVTRTTEPIIPPNTGVLIDGQFGNVAAATAQPTIFVDNRADQKFFEQAYPDADIRLRSDNTGRSNVTVITDPSDISKVLSVDPDARVVLDRPPSLPDERAAF
jgi:hypothetical protein